MKVKTVKETVEFLKRHSGLIKHKTNLSILVPFPYDGFSILSINGKDLIKIIGYKSKIYDEIINADPEIFLKKTEKK